MTIVLFFGRAGNYGFAVQPPYGGRAQAIRLAYVGVRVSPSAEIAFGNKRKPGGLLLLGSDAPLAEIAFGNGLRALPCTRKGHRPLTHITI